MASEIKKIIDEEELEIIFLRVSCQILEYNKNIEDLLLVGIKTYGLPMANRIAGHITKITGKNVPVGAIDISLYRPDFSPIKNGPLVHAIDLPFSVTNKNVVLIDDLILTGKTARAGIETIFDTGQPEKVQLFALLDIRRRKIPVYADFIGRKLSLNENEIIELKLKEYDNEDAVFIKQPN